MDEKDVKIKKNIKIQDFESLGSKEKYLQSLNLTKKIFPDLDFFQCPPCFFEGYNSKEDKGMIIDSNNLEIRIYNKEYLEQGKKLVRNFRKNGLGYLLFVDY